MEQQNETQRLIASLEQWLFLVASRNHPTQIREVEDIRNVSWGTAPTDWGKHFRDGKLRIETFFYTPTRYLLSVDPKVSHAVMTYLALTEQPNYGKGAGYASDELPAWYIDGMPEPPLLGEDPSETNL